MLTEFVARLIEIEGNELRRSLLVDILGEEARAKITTALRKYVFLEAHVTLLVGLGRHGGDEPLRRIFLREVG